jgi:membrane associated rhomboid family serine protease
VADGRPGTSGVIWAVLAIIFVLFQMLMLADRGPGE